MGIIGRDYSDVHLYFIRGQRSLFKIMTGIHNHYELRKLNIVTKNVNDAWNFVTEFSEQVLQYDSSQLTPVISAQPLTPEVERNISKKNSSSRNHHPKEKSVFQKTPDDSQDMLDAALDMIKEKDLIIEEKTNQLTMLTLRLAKEPYKTSRLNFTTLISMIAFLLGLVTLFLMYLLVTKFDK